MSEHDLYKQIAIFMQMKYPNVIYRFDLAADLKLTVGQARKHKILHPYRGYPDLFIAESAPRCIDGSWKYEWYGLFIELKKDGTRLKKKNGEWASEHIAEQAHMLSELTARGYKADFAIGFNQAVRLIDDYLESGKEDTNQWF